ncbi:MAG TPA: AtpZ/AtpI family protein [Actinomycetota bacterium]|nr:AtpZ/AtpI family protein [Actinomycetota bacterium]
MAGKPDRGDPWTGAGMAWAIIGTLLAGIIAWGGVGYLLDRWIGSNNLFLPIGMVLGAAGALYLVYMRYGKS